MKPSCKISLTGVLMVMSLKHVLVKYEDWLFSFTVVKNQNAVRKSPSLLYKRSAYQEPIK